MDISMIIFKKIKGTPFAAIDGEVINRQRRTHSSPDIDPHPGFLHLPVALVLQGSYGIVGKDDIALTESAPEDLLHYLDSFVGLHEPTGLGRPGNRHPFPLEDAVLSVEGQMIGKLAHNYVGQESRIGFASGDGMIGHGGGNDPGAFRQTILRTFIDVDQKFPRAVLQLFRDLHPDHLQRSPCFGADLLLFGDIQQDLHPFEMFGNGNAAMVSAGAGSFPNGFFHRRFGGCIHPVFFD